MNTKTSQEAEVPSLVETLADIPTFAKHREVCAVSVQNGVQGDKPPDGVPGVSPG